MNQLVFQLPSVWWWGVPAVAAALGYFYWSLASRQYARRRVFTLLALRGLTLLLLLGLLARPAWVAKEDEEPRERPVVVLLDRSASMALRERGQDRYTQALDFLRGHLLPELKRRELRTEAVLFAGDAEDADGGRIVTAEPDGEQTDLAAAIVQSVSSRQPPPLSIVALTDGAATRNDQNRRAVSTLVQNGIPFAAVGFGSETGTRTLSLERIDAPATIPTDQQFSIAVQLQATGEGRLPPFDLVLTRNGQFAARQKIDSVAAPRYWQVSFERTEPDEALVSYAVQLLPPADPEIVCPQREISSSVRVTEEQDLRVLFVQGGLTWDYKFVRLAVGDDPSIRLSALSRTANRSSQFQSVQGDAELASGFPTTLQQLSRYRVIVLSNVGPSDLSDQQQELLDRFCGEFAGGLLVMGGPSTINASWRGTRLEQLMPVAVSPLGQGLPGGGMGPPAGRFRVRPSPGAAGHPVLQIAGDGEASGAWSNLPPFHGYAQVERVKPGAEVWLEAAGAAQGAPLMAVQRYGRGLSAVLCLQNFWRWRLAKEADTAHFDRFWRQLLRFLSEGSRDTLWLQMPSQQMEPGRDLRVVVERRPDPRSDAATATPYSLRVLNEQQQEISRQRVDLRPGQSAELTFQVADSGLYHLSVVDQNQIVHATRSADIRTVPYEFVKTSRDMENLRQWARLSGGLAVKAEECADARQLVERLEVSAQRIHRQQPRSAPAGINGWMLAAALAGICGEWALRKRWSLV